MTYEDRAELLVALEAIKKDLHRKTWLIVCRQRELKRDLDYIKKVLSDFYI